MGKVLAVDYGDKKCGLAISSEDRKWVFGRGIIETYKIFDKIKELTKEEEVSEIVIGRPLGLKSQKTLQTKKVLEFLKKIEKEIDKKIILIDERFTSKLAKKYVGEKDLDDEMAARIILEGYLGV